MAVHPTTESFVAALPPGGTLIGMDLGEKTIGLAISDPRQGLASPLRTIRRRKFTLDAADLLQTVAERDVIGLLLGLPLNMDGTEGPRAQSTRAFARNLSALTPLPIGFWDERLSTVAAERALLDADMSRAKRAAVIDHVAAGVILQGFLDRLAVMRRNQTGQGAATD